MKFASEALILTLMILSNGRVFTIRHSKVDSLVMLSPVALLLSILELFAFGFDILIGLILLTAILVILSNFHALFRYGSRLIVDHYSTLMKVWAVITEILCFFLLFCIIKFRPYDILSKKLGVQEIHKNYEGSMAAGFNEKNGITGNDATLYIFAPESEQNNEKILFMSDKRGDTASYIPYLQLLAKNGYQVFSADFYSKDLKYLHTLCDSRFLRQFALSAKSLINPLHTTEQREFYTYNIKQEYEALLKILDDEYSENSFIFITDEMSNQAALDIQKKYPAKVRTIIYLPDFDSYKTPGYGFITQTNPFLEHLFSYKTEIQPSDLELTVLQTIEEIKKHDAE